MKVLFVTHAEKTHFLGMVPPAWALHNAGHEVRVASQPELTDVITSAGLTAVPVGRNHLLHQFRRHADLLTDADGPDADGPRQFDMAEDRPEALTWEYLRNGYRDEVVPWWWRVVNDPMIVELTAFCRYWKPDLVLWEPVTFAGAVAAKACGAAHGRFMWSLDLFARMRGHYLRVRREQAPKEPDALAEWLGARAAKVGTTFSEDLTTGQFTVDYTPTSLRLDVPLHYLPLRYIPYNGPSVIPAWLHHPPDRPRVCLTLGTSATERLDGYSVSVQDILTHLADLDIDLVVTLPDELRDSLAHIPANVRIVPFVPLNALAPTCSAVINHGGPGTVFSMAAHGVPQLVAPTLFDEPVLAGRLAEQGSGLVIDTSQASGPVVREHLMRLLKEPGFTQAAVRLRQEMAAMPGPNQLVAQLEAIASAR